MKIFVISDLRIIILNKPTPPTMYSWIDVDIAIWQNKRSLGDMYNTNRRRLSRLAGKRSLMNFHNLNSENVLFRCLRKGNREK